MSDSYSSLSNAPANHSIQDLIQPLASGKGWMKFLGVVFIVVGALYAITLVGILVAWLPIWIGVLLMQSAGALERAQFSGDAAAMKEALSKLRSFFVIQGVMMIIGIALWVLLMILYGAVFVAMLHNGGSWH
ncbi:DUF5362 domain-containing protein [Dyella japonica]|uniref:Transmembrane protein n=1 Tax=Dyella japonica A8 TaxID=1217721 RepID=A0A075K5L8_9GAMM|nr:DUF5362 domain-containing protein [Dyella japonica]AIF49420.1 hypothetical protein HY57_20225 [Dyella japonica A8]